MIKQIICLILIVTISSCKNDQLMPTTHAFRLKPGQDLKASIDSFVKAKKIQAGWIATCVGSLTDYNIRFANQEKGYSDKGHFEIVSLVGTVSVNGSHLHVSISDSTGKTVGGHLLEGCKIYTTAEIVITETKELIFARENDGSTPWQELQVKEAKKPE
ncbi:MAG: PPC domain-containing DNA-binding protein [Sediminibacterium sp.]